MRLGPPSANRLALRSAESHFTYGLMNTERERPSAIFLAGCPVELVSLSNEGWHKRGSTNRPSHGTSATRELKGETATTPTLSFYSGDHLMTKMLKIAALLTLVLTFVVKAPAQTVTVGSPQTVLTASQRISLTNQYFPDGMMSAFLYNGTNYVFGSDGLIYGFTSTNLENLASNLSPIDITTNLSYGSSSNAFDYNYAGGGPVYYDTATGILLLLYHGENWYGGDGSPFYASLGLAYSTNLGATWNNLGEVISPQTARSGSWGNCNVDVGGGSLVPVTISGTLYLYAYYVDMASDCDTGNYNVAVARATESSLVAAAQAGTPFTSGAGTLFQKYYNGSFSQNGVTDLANPQNGGGAFTALIANNNELWPTVNWNSYLNDYVMAYSTDFTGISVAFSPDGVTWGTPTQVVGGGNAPPNAIYYPSLLNTGGGDPETLGQQFYLYYVDPFGDWSQSNLMRVQIAVSGSSSPPPAPPAPPAAPTNLHYTVH